MVLSRVAHTVCCVALTLAAVAAAAQSDYPNKPIRLINPNPAGSSSDVIARGYATELGSLLGQQVWVDNKGGAGSTIGSAAGAKSPPDGYTLTQTSSPLFAVVPLIYKKLNFDPVKDFKSIMVTAYFENVLVVNPKIPAKTLAELVALAKAKPGALTYASSGNGTTLHLSAEMLRQMAGIDIKHVPYRGGAPAITDVIGGQVDMMFNTVPGAIQHIKSGAMRPIAVTGAKRNPALPDVPTLAESGVPGYQAGGWFSVSVPTGTPQAIVDKLSEASMKVAHSPTFMKLMEENGFAIIGGSPAHMDSLIQDEIRRWGVVVRAIDIQMD